MRRTLKLPGIDLHQLRAFVAGFGSLFYGIVGAIDPDWPFIGAAIVMGLTLLAWSVVEEVMS